MRKLLLSISIFLALGSFANSQAVSQSSSSLSATTESAGSSSMSQSSSTAEGSVQENMEVEQEINSELSESLEKNKLEGVQSLKAGMKTSSIEGGFFARTKAFNIRLRQFGYNFFLGKPRLALSIPVDKSYVLGPGDELFLYVIGNPPGVDLSKINRLVVDREGKIYMPGLGVFYVWGMTLGEAENLISKSLGTNIKLTVGRLRTFPVYVSGEVRRPGAVVVTGVNTVIDAIMMAGGIQKSGTLRDVIVTRKTSKGLKRIHIDFYKLLLEGKPIDMKLKDGDVIFVGSIGKVAGIAGKVKRPAIYELKGDETVKDLIKMAGGLLPSSYKYKVIIQRYKDNQFLEVLEGSLNDKKFTSQKVQDGDLIVIKPIIDIPENAVMIGGYTTYPGLYEYKKGMKLSDLLKQDLFFPDSNMKFGLIERRYPLGSLPKYLTFSPEDVLKGKVDIELKPKDKITLYKFGETKVVDFNRVKDAFVVEGEIKYPGVYAYKKGMKLSDILNPDMLMINTNLYYAEIDRRDPETLDIVDIKKFVPMNVLQGKEDLEIHKLDVIKFYPKYVYPPVKVSGLVKESYYLPYHEGLKLSEALSSAKFAEDIKKLKVEVFREVSKTKSSESLQKAENIKVNAESGKDVIRQNVASIFLYDLLIKKDSKVDITLNPGDRLVIQEVKPKEMVEKVTVLGYVKNPGVFKINEKTTLYDVLKAAGGFRENAYPQGIVVLRRSVKEMQKERIAKAVALMKQELEKEEAGVMQSDLTQDELRARQAAFEAKRRLLSEIEKVQVTGRISGIVVPYDLEKLKNSPYNILLEDGDKIYIPKKPSSVLIFGEVYNPSAYVYEKGMTVKDCISSAGGLTKDADVENIFVIKANGRALSSQSKSSIISWNEEKKRFVWGSDSNDILNYKLEPGDAVIVPTKVHVPVMWRPLIKDVIQIMYQSALTVYTVKRL
ncbi:SLBB domain-containing protein [Desulfurobacterium thermolithotrophum]|uniref:SLBB domain-containing protein n=1 Tax=Desulfurobacterium thermolithotrophum TaxID=64160 RepID=UPI0013D81ACC|nr:SLBB domain-containing protein [Desulfurobacterium thermolithotrophum]